MCNFGSARAVLRVLQVPPERPVVAYRGWDVATNGRLAGLYYTTWYSDAHGACRADRRPSRRNEHGFYGWKEPRAALRYFHANASRCRTSLFGQVTFWGKVVEYADGYRAEWARVQALVCVVAGDAAAFRSVDYPALVEEYGVLPVRLERRQLRQELLP